jgi:replicative DNA helicase
VQGFYNKRKMRAEPEMVQCVSMANAPTQLRVPPQALDAEKALLGAIMLKPECMYDVSDIISSDSFYVDKHRTIYAAIKDLFVKSDPIDVLSVSERLKSNKELERVGGRTYLAELSNSTPATANAYHYAQLVGKTATLRALIEGAEFIAELGFDESQELEDILDAAEKRLMEITNTPSLHKFASMRDELGEAWDRFETLHKSKDEMRGIPTGFAALDNLLAGFQKSDLVILAARPSVGKTSLALDIARQTAIQHGVSVGIFSLEMSSQQLVDRMLASEARVDAWKLRTGNLSTDTEFERVREAIGKLSTAPIFMDDKPGNNILSMRSVARRMKREHNLGLVIVDYLQLMTPTGKHAGDSMVQQVTEISRALKGLARELDVPVLALSQLSRAVEQRGGKPRLSDLRDSGSIEQDADVVMFIHRDDKQNAESDKPNIAEILVEKHRNGPVGMVELFFDDKKTSFLSIDKSHAATSGGDEEW